MSDRDEQGKFIKGNQYEVQKGERLNPDGRPSGISIHARLRDILDGEEGSKVIDAIARAGIKHAVKGNPRFWEMIVSIIDGKIPDRIAGHDGGPITFDADAKERIKKMVEAADFIDDKK